MNLYEAMEKKNADEISEKLATFKEREKETLNAYVASEMVPLSDAEYDFIFKQSMLKAMDRVPDKIMCRNSSSAIMSYLQISIDRALKLYKCKKNKVTPHYGDMLVSIQGNGLDIWKEDDATKIKEYMKSQGKKDVDRIFCNLRDEFSHAQPENCIKHFGMVQLRNLVADTLNINERFADEVILLYYSGLNLWDDKEGVQFANDILYSEHPETKVKKMKRQYSEDAVKSLFKYLDQCVLPDKSVLKVKKTKPKTIDNLLVAEVKVRAEKLVRKTELTEKEVKIIEDKFEIDKRHVEMLKEIHAQDMDLWKTDMIDLASVVLLVKPDTKKPLQVVQKLMAYDMVVVDATNKIFDTVSKTKPKTTVAKTTVKTKARKADGSIDYGKMPLRELFAMK